MVNSKPISTSNALLVLPALQACANADGSFMLTRKFLDGVLQYVQRWPGDVIVAIEQSRALNDNLDHIAVHPEHAGFTLQWISPQQQDGELLELIARSSVALASLVDKHVHVPQLCRRLGVPLVYISEYSLRTRVQIIRAETRNPLLRWRRSLWTRSLEQKYIRALRQAAGVQCNGTPTFDAYSGINPRPLLYFDTRVGSDHIVAERTLHQRLEKLRSGGPLRLGFSGRLIAMKGVDHLPRVARELRKQNVPFTMEICGGGALEPQLVRRIRDWRLEDQVHLRGVLDFQKQLMPLVSRSIDLFVCCHRQGDPSCTYLETMSCGTPIVGYDNDAFAGLVQRAGVGWPTPLDRPRELASQIAQLHRNREALARAAWASRAFAAKHTFERTMQARIDHLLQCAHAHEAVESPAT